MKHLHENSILLRNLNASDILYQRDPETQYINISISGFDYAKKYYFKTYGAFGCSVLYLPLEVLNDEGYTLSIDSWALGVLIYYLCSKQLKF